MDDVTTRQEAPGNDAASALLGFTDLFGAMPHEARERLAGCATFLDLEAGETLVRAGEPADALFVVARGQLAAQLALADGEAREIARFTTGDCVGEMAFVAALARREPVGRRTATVLAREPSRVLRFGAEVVLRLQEEDAAFRAALATLVSRRTAEFREYLAPLFGSLPDDVLAELQGEVQERVLCAGEILFRQGEPGDAVYIVLAGRLQILRQDGDAVRCLAELGPGEPAGEAALLARQPRSATVRAVRGSVIARLSNESVERVVRSHPDALISLTRILAQRMTASPVAAGRVKTIAFVPGAAGVPVRGLVERLAPLLGGDVCVLDAARFDEIHGAGAAQSVPGELLWRRTSQWIRREERARDHLVFLANPKLDPWTERCLRESDRVVLVARPEGSVRPGAAERALLERREPTRPHVDLLVLLHRPGTAHPSGTDRWLEPRPGVRHLHVREGDAEHHGRLARFLEGRATSLVLSGGAALGYCHAGVLQALVELGVPVDYVGGSSLGSGVAALWALGRDVSGVLDGLHAVCVKSGMLRVPSPPVVALFRAEGLEAALREECEERNIEDLWLPYFAASSNLTRMSLEVHERGPLWRAIRASSSLPGIWPPVYRDGEVLVDGGLIDNLPVRPMRERCAGPVVACDVQPLDPLAARRELEKAPSAVAVLADRLLHALPSPLSVLRDQILGPGQLPHPTIAEILIHSMLCCSQRERHEAFRSADLVLRPDTTGLWLVDFRTDLRAAAKRGYEVAMKARDALLALRGSAPAHTVSGRMDSTR